MRHEYPFSSIVPSSWAVVNTQPHRERTALENLARQDFHAYCPMVRKRIRHARRAQDALRPLFPGYVFVRVDPDLRRWRPILSTIGVRTVVCCRAQPSLVDDGLRRRLQARQIAGGLAEQGKDVAVAGLPPRTESESLEQLVQGRLRIIRIRAWPSPKPPSWRRALCRQKTNPRLLWRLRRHLRNSDTILFTGSPP